MSARVNVKSFTAESLGFSYGTTTVVEDVSFKLGAGEFVALVGPNGCGKSTLLRLMLGELRAGKGVMKIDGDLVATYGRHGVARRWRWFRNKWAGWAGPPNLDIPCARWS